MALANTDPCFLPAHQLAAEIAARRLSPVDVVEAFLARIAALDRQAARLYRGLRRRRAARRRGRRQGDPLRPRGRAAARRADRAEGPDRPRRPGHHRRLDGVARPPLAGHRDAGAEADRAGHDRARQDPHGRVRDGRLGHQPASRHAVEPVGPRRRRARPGGSSSGSGVAVAAGMAPWAIGTDTGGSVRLPASWCGLTGLKTTIGRVSTYGILPLAPSLDTPGPMARSVEDAALLLQASCRAPTRSTRAPCRRRRRPMPMPALKRGVRGLRLGAHAGGRARRLSPPRCWPPTTRRSRRWRGWAPRSSRSRCRAASPTRRGDRPDHRLRGLSLVGDLVDDPALPIDDGGAAAHPARPRHHARATISPRCAERDAMKREFLGGVGRRSTRC